MRATYPDLPSVGRFESETFEPEKWTPLYDGAPFANRLPDDTFWAARQVMAFSDEDIRAIVQVAQYSDPEAERWIADRLIDRRDRIGRTYFDGVLPLDDFAVRGDELTFRDLAVQHRFVEPRAYRVDWWLFDNRAGKPSSQIGPPTLERQRSAWCDRRACGQLRHGALRGRRGSVRARRSRCT